MDHIVYLDSRANELDNLLESKKSMIIRGAMGRKMPYGRVEVGDILYFAENKGDGLIKAKAKVKKVFNSEKLSVEESVVLVKKNQSKLRLNDNLMKRFSGKRYLVLIEVEEIESLRPFKFDRSDYGNMDDWLFVEKIDKVKR